MNKPEWHGFNQLAEEHPRRLYQFHIEGFFNYEGTDQDAAKAMYAFLAITGFLADNLSIECLGVQEPKAKAVEKQ